jgi:hypothetical protein
MIRNLKVLLAAAMALAAFGALSATAHATEEFHCSVEPCTWTINPDGTGATVHHVLILKNKTSETSSTTCNSLSGEATSTTKTSESITAKNLVYNTCRINGVTLFNLRMNGCTYTFGSKNGATGATVEIKCPEAKHIEIEIISTGCRFEVTPQTLTGAKYHNIGTLGTTSTEVTVQLLVKSIVVEVGASGTGCIPKAATGETLSGEITTGNMILTAEKDNTNKEMVEGWWS